MAEPIQWSPLMVATPGLGVIALKATIGASGAVSSWDGFGVSNFAKNTTGVYDITLNQGFRKVVYFDGSCIATTGALNHPVLDVDYTEGSTTLQIATRVQAGTDTEPASGDKICVFVLFDLLGLA